MTSDNAPLSADPAHNCLLCRQSRSLEEFYRKPDGSLYFRCGHCGFIFLSTQYHLEPDDEKSRYHLHQNDVEDKRYQDFLMPVVQGVLQTRQSQDQGLDFGCGPASVVVHLLRQKGFQIEGFDPVFCPNDFLLNRKYDYVTCTEVVEHFTNPPKSWDLLISLLKPGASLFIKTSLTDTVKDFPRWHYHRDPTHVGFYSRSSFEFIKDFWGLAELVIEPHYIRLTF